MVHLDKKEYRGHVESKAQSAMTLKYLAPKAMQD
jgi:hypothetical protein